MNEIRYVGLADGPMTFIPELGCEVPTFKQEPGGKKLALNYHIPPSMRGDFRPTDLANYDPNKEYRTDVTGRVLCYAVNKSGLKCSKRAQNRTPRCIVHGGRLHPLDKIVQDKEETTESQGLSRYRQFVAGQITANDLDDEELAACGFRGVDGRIFKPRNVPRELAQAFTRAIYERAQQELRSNTVKAAQVMAGIMVDESVDASIRLKAAESIIERNLGKTPQVVAITGQAAYEEIFSEITGGPRDESRRVREIESAQSDIIEADVIYDSTDDSVDESTTASPNLEPAQHNSVIGEQDFRDSRLFQRNEAILAQTVEIKPFEFDLRAEEPGSPLVREKTITKDGRIRIRHVDPNDLP